MDARVLALVTCRRARRPIHNLTESEKRIRALLVRIARHPNADEVCKRAEVLAWNSLHLELRIVHTPPASFSEWRACFTLIREIVDRVLEIEESILGGTLIRRFISSVVVQRVLVWRRHQRQQRRRKR
jgi:hypothetical protein